MRKKKNNNFINFILYCFCIMSFTVFLLISLTLKNECMKNEMKITELNKQKMHNINIVKELQIK